MGSGAYGSPSLTSPRTPITHWASGSPAVLSITIDRPMIPKFPFRASRVSTKKPPVNPPAEVFGVSVPPRSPARVRPGLGSTRGDTNTLPVVAMPIFGSEMSPHVCTSMLKSPLGRPKIWYWTESWFRRFILKCRIPSTLDPGRPSKSHVAAVTGSVSSWSSSCASFTAAIPMIQTPARDFSSPPGVPCTTTALPMIELTPFSRACLSTNFPVAVP
mmetsp:Transcript_2232/g.2606  ORF Transcript_2232/g.2606 Transcript_2232/m.2606 type:complete len:216 (-) Transcript_2232:526-1173(-)